MAFFFSFFSFEKFEFEIKQIQRQTEPEANRAKQIFKSKAMTNFIIKTHSKGTIYNKPHLFILNKGLNSGKPQKEQFTNSFVIIFEKEQDAENIYFIAFSLWKSSYWHHYLCGSVIPFLRLHDFKKEFNIKCNLLMYQHEEHLKNVKALKLLEQKEEQLQENIKLINQLRKAIVYSYCNQSG